MTLGKEMKTLDFKKKRHRKYLTAEQAPTRPQQRGLEKQEGERVSMLSRPPPPPPPDPNPNWDTLSQLQARHYDVPFEASRRQHVSENSLHQQVHQLRSAAMSSAEGMALGTPEGEQVAFAAAHDFLMGKPTDPAGAARHWDLLCVLSSMSCRRLLKFFPVQACGNRVLEFRLLAVVCVFGYQTKIVKVPGPAILTSRPDLASGLANRVTSA